MLIVEYSIFGIIKIFVPVRAVYYKLPDNCNLSSLCLLPVIATQQLPFQSFHAVASGTLLILFVPPEAVSPCLPLTVKCAPYTFRPL